MKCLLSILVATSVLAAPSVQAQKGGQGEKKDAITFTDVVISSALSKAEHRQAWLFDAKKGSATYHFVVNDGTKFVKVVNGKRVPVPAREGRSQLKIGKVISVRGKQAPRGIIAVLIAL